MKMKKEFLLVGFAVIAFLWIVNIDRVSMADDEIYVYNSAGTQIKHYSPRNMSRQKLKLVHTTLADSKYKRIDTMPFRSSRVIGIYRIRQTSNRKYILYSNKILLLRENRKNAITKLTVKQYQTLKSLDR